MNIFYYDIAVGLPLRQCFTYKSKEVIKKGKRVIVPFGSKSIVGIVVKKIAKPKSLKGLKEIISIADEYSCFNGSIFEAITWASDYYHHPIGEVFFSFMPTLLRKQNDKIIIDLDDNTEYKLNEKDKKLKLTKEQNINLSKLNKVEKFSPSLIYGVTGSGKTEIYLQLAEKFILQNKSILILVPEINLIPQLEKRFKDRFNGDIGVYHSRQTPNQRLKVWLRSKFGEIRIVIGTRSSVLMPLKNLGAIIIDEEHDSSYKQESSPRYLTHEVARKRADIHHAKLVFGSATPSLSTFASIRTNDYGYYRLTKRYNDITMPQVSILDLTAAIHNHLVHDDLIEQIQTTLAIHRTHIPQRLCRILHIPMAHRESRF